MYALAIDTETNGLQIKHGCRAFVVTAGDTDSNLYEWWFSVNPFTREVTYPDHKVLNLFNTLKKFPIWIFHNSLFDLNVLQEIVSDSVTKEDWQNLISQTHIEDTQLMCHADNSLTTNALKPQSFYHFDYPEDDERDLLEAVKKSRTIASTLGWAIAEPTHPHLTALKEGKTKCDYWLPHTLAEHHPRLVPSSYANLCKRYALGDVERTLGLFYHFTNSWPKWRLQAYQKNAKCLLPTFFMINQGFPLKEAQVPSTLKKLLAKREELQSSLQESVEALGYLPPDTKAQTYEPGDSFTFNQASAPQLQKLLFNTLKLPKVKTTDTGQASTDKETLEELLLTPKVIANPKISRVLKDILYLRKVKTTEGYLNNYKVHKVGNKLYPSLNPTGTKTLRFSCSNPNSQNISGKSSEDQEGFDVSFSLRNMFGPPEGYLWACIDYSQLQLRIFAYACKDQTLISSFERGDDAHDTVARKIFSIPAGKNPSKTQRTIAKGINFGIIFGAGPSTIEAITGVKGTYESFREKFPLVDSYIQEQEEYSKKHGYCLTLGGYPLAVSRSKAYRACNYVVQGTEGELVKDALYLVYEYCKQPSVLFFPIMTIHDEIIFQSKRKMTLQESKSLTPRSQLNTIEKLMNQAAANVGVITEVDCTFTTTLWSEAK